MNPLIELNKHPLPAEQVEKLSGFLCSKCGGALEPSGLIRTGWKHVEAPSFEKTLPCHGNARPSAKTEATTFALKYVHEQRLPAWVVEHIANAYSFGEMEGIKRGRAE